MIPSYLTPAQVALANEMRTEHCREKLARAGILEPDGPHRFHVAESRLRERLPDMYERVFRWFELGHGKARRATSRSVEKRHSDDK